MDLMENTFVFLREVVKIWENACFNLNGTKHTFKKRNVLHEWNSIFQREFCFQPLN